MKRAIFIDVILLFICSCGKEYIVDFPELPGWGSNNGYEYVDLGLSVKWAVRNVGASNPKEYGDYYAWGETDVKNSYTFTNYKFCTSCDDYYNVKFSKYNTRSSYGMIDNKITLDPENDVAHVKWGGHWRIPTKEEQDELYNNCSWKWYDGGNSEFDGVPGYKVTSNVPGYTDRFIFLPAAGSHRYDTYRYDDGCGMYWASTLFASGPDVAYGLYFESNYVGLTHFERDGGYSVRPVCPSDEWLSHISITFSNDEITLIPGSSGKLIVNVKKDGGEYSYSDFVWKSDNPKVATVNEQGFVTALQKGSAHIFAAIGHVSAQCTINVKDESQIEIEHECVDLGLSVKWATSNVGASKPEEYGGYYAWGEIEPKSSYYWTNYKFRISGDSYSNVKFSKYNTISSSGTVDNNSILELNDDVARVKWGGDWRMPTNTEWMELVDNSTIKWYGSGNTEFNGVAGYKVTSNVPGYTDRFIFLPDAGWRDGTYFEGVCEYSCYWSSSLGTDDSNVAWSIGIIRAGDHFRYYGYSVRPVCPSEEWLSSISIKFVEDDETLPVDGNVKLNVVVKQNNEVISNSLVIWSSDNPSVAVVDQNGVVTAIKTGTAHITASIQSLSAQCTVNVIDESEVRHTYVDLGLSVKWATFNVGAIKPEDYGAYFAWGETGPKTDYSWSTYRYANSSYDRLTKYCDEFEYGNSGFTDSRTKLELNDDVARQKWGGSWRMPTEAEQNDLRNKCTWKWYSSDNIEFNGVAGYKVTSNVSGYTNRFIFLPAAGYRYGTSLSGAGSNGYYWSSSLNTDYPYSAWGISFGSDGHYANYYGRYNGLSVWPVCP